MHGTRLHNIKAAITYKHWVCYVTWTQLPAVFYLIISMVVSFQQPILIFTEEKMSRRSY